MADHAAAVDESPRLVRVYSGGISAADAVPLNTSAIRRIRFSLPSTMLSWSAGVNISDGRGFPVGWNPLDTFAVKFELEGGEPITTDSRLGGSVLGDGKHMGHVGGSGWPFTVGSVLVVTITPRLPGLPAGVLDVATDLGVAEMTLSRLERGTHRPSADTARKLARWLGWTVEQVLEAAERPGSDP